MQLVDDEVRNLISNQYERVKALLKEKEKARTCCVFKECTEFGFVVLLSLLRLISFARFVPASVLPTVS